MSNENKKLKRLRAKGVENAIVEVLLNSGDRGTKEWAPIFTEYFFAESRKRSGKGGAEPSKAPKPVSILEVQNFDKLFDVDIGKRLEEKRENARARGEKLAFDCFHAKVCVMDGRYRVKCVEGHRLNPHRRDGAGTPESVWSGEEYAVCGECPDFEPMGEVEPSFCGPLVRLANTT